MKTYIVASAAAVEWAHAEEGEQINLDLEPGQERALLAAGWLEEVPAKKKKEE